MKLAITDPYPSFQWCLKFWKSTSFPLLWITCLFTVRYLLHSGASYLEDPQALLSFQLCLAGFSNLKIREKFWQSSLTSNWKAFDSVPHLPLINRLEETGLHPFTLAWVGNYLLHRRQQVTIGNATSSSLSVISGVPQGSVLGPLLFLVYIDSITKVTLSCESQLVLFADDMSLSKPVVYPNDLSDLQSDVDLIYSWATQNYLTFNAHKCKYMLLSRKRYKSAVICNI